MTEITRHVGKLKNTGQKCVVIYRKIPNAEDFALVVQSDQLPDRYHDNLMTVINSDDAQQTHDLYTVLARRSFGDGGQILETLHVKGFLIKVPVDDVILYPLPNQALPLSQANEQIDGLTVAQQHQDTTTQQNVTNPQYTDTDALGDDKEAIAASKIEQAELMENDAARLREEAYTLDPNLKPSAGRPELSESEKARRKEEHNAKRREKYKKKKSKKKKKDPVNNNNDINESIERKIDRDISRREKENQE